MSTGVPAPYGRRGLRVSRALLGGVAALALAVVVPRSAGADTAYVVSSSGRMIAVDAESGRQSAAIDLSNPGNGPVVIAPDGKTAYVSTADAVTPVSTESGRVGAAIPVGSRSGDIAVSPDGRLVLAVAQTGNTVTPISTATDTAGPPVAIARPSAIAITPDGRTAYAASADRALTPIDLVTFAPGPPVALAHPADDIAITPDGALAIIGETESAPFATSHGYVQVVDLRSGRAEAPVAVDDRPVGPLAIAPDGRTAYIGEGANSPTAANGMLDNGGVAPFDIAARTVGAPLGLPVGPGGSVADLAVSGDGTGLLGAVPCNDMHCVSGGVFVADRPPGASPRFLDLSNLKVGGRNNPEPRGLALVPTPSAGFTAAPGPSGAMSSFDAAASGDAGGTVTAYVWDFGDGSPTQTTTTPATSHAYARPGAYTVTLTTTSRGGCAARSVYTGHMATCTGSPLATASRPLTVITPAAAAATTGEGTLRLQSHALTLRGAATRLTLRCASRRPCRGRLSLTARAGRRTVRCGRATFRLGAGRSGHVPVTMAPSCRSLARHATAHRAAVRLTAQTASGQHGVARTVWLVWR